MVRDWMIRLVVLSRWAMAPLFVGLFAGLLLLVAAYFRELWVFAVSLPTATETQIIMGLLTLIDLVLVGGLIVIVIASGYENFVEKIDRADAPASPEWMTRISFSGLKMKLFASLMAICAITLLKALMRLETDVSEVQVRWLVIANVIFVCAYGVLALTDRFASGARED